MKLDVKIDISGALEKFGRAADEYPQAVSRALNKTATTARAEAARDIRAAGYGIKIGVIKKAIKIERATRDQLRAVLNARGRPIPLIQYRARQTKKGVTVTVLNGSKSIDGAFIATMPNGHKGVYVRVGSAAERAAIARGRLKIHRGKTKRSYKHGLPIRQLFGPSVPDAMANAAVERAITQAINDRFPVVMRQEVDAIRGGFAK